MFHQELLEQSKLAPDLDTLVTLNGPSSRKVEKVAEPRILLYSHDTYGLGHTQRTISIAGAILERKPGAKVLYVTGSPMIQNLKLPYGMDYVKLPSATKLGSEKYAARSLTLPFDQLLHIRSKLIRTVADEFRPDVFLVDHAPIGMSGEILPTLRSLRKSGTKIVLGMRDVLDDPVSVASVWQKQRIISILRRYYDLILVYGMMEFYDPVMEYGIPPDVGQRTRFTGYVYRPRPIQPARAVRERFKISAGPFVLVTVGGGEDSRDALDLVINALRVRPLEGLFALITTGPMCPDSVKGTLTEEEKDSHILVTEFVEDLPSVIAAADLVVCMGGYNSLSELLAYGHRGIVLPRTAPRREQLIRSSFLANLGFVTNIVPCECTPLALRETIEAKLSDKAEPLSEKRRMVKLDGGGKAADLILSLVEAADKREIVSQMGGSSSRSDALIEGRTH